MITQGYHSIITPCQQDEAERLLHREGLFLPQGTDAGLGFFEDGVLMGVGFLAKNLICGICVATPRRGEGLAAGLVGRLLSLALERGFGRVCITTKAEEAEKFTTMGFNLVGASEQAALLEFGSPLYTQWMSAAREQLLSALPAPTPPAPRLGCVVMNANPFTLGHRALVCHALATTKRVLVFVVEEEASAFPFALRHALVSQGLADLPGVTILPGGPYIVSRASFPAYFTGKEEHAAVHAGLDAVLFASRIAPDLGIQTRFVGSEPQCLVTAMYNATLAEVLPRHSVSLVEIPRRTSSAAAISASRVRQLMTEEGFQSHPEWFNDLVPPSTLEVLLSEQGRRIANILVSPPARILSHQE